MRRAGVLRLGIAAGAVLAGVALTVNVVATHRSSGVSESASQSQPESPELQAAEVSSPLPVGTYVLSDDPNLLTVLRSCPHVPNAGAASTGECGPLDYLPDYSTVIMRCWVDEDPPPGSTSPRWFYVNELDGPHPGYSGYVYSGLVKQQTPTPACTNAIVDQYEMPKYVSPPPLSFKVVGSCTTAGGTLTAVSSNFTPGAQFEVNAAYPNGSPYPLAKTAGTINSDGSAPWSWPCAGDPAGDYSTELVDLGTGRTVTTHFHIASAASGEGESVAPAAPSPTQAPPPDQLQPAPIPPPVPDDPPQPTTRTITVYNQVTNGPTQMREDIDHPAYLSAVPRKRCKDNGCALPNTDVSTGAQLTAICQIQGERITNGEDGDSIDDSNPGLRESMLWYGVRWADGRFGYISEIWINESNRGGLGLPGC